MRAGIIKVAAMSPLTQWEKERFRAAAQIQKELNITIATHATQKPGDQFDWLVKNGANPNRLFFSHIEYLMRFLCDKGYDNKVMKSMDTYPYWNNGKIFINIKDK